MAEEALYITLEKEASASFVEKKSEFIGYACPCKTEQEALDFIAKIRKKHADAKHNVYAYQIKENNIARFTDDGEPQGTAGMPVLDIIKKTGFTDACIVVTRYFGGILLGTGGLVRAYTSSVSEACAAAPKLHYCPYDLYRLDVPFKLWGKLEGSIYSLGGMIKSIEYAENIRLMLYIPPEQASRFAKTLSELSAGKLSAEFIETEAVATEI